MKRTPWMVTVAVLAACGASPAAAKVATPKIVTITSNTDAPDASGAHPGVWHGTIDGVECIVVSGTSGGLGGSNTPAISCKWSVG